MITAVPDDDVSSIVLQAQDGCREAFDNLVLRFRPEVFRSVLRRVENVAEADEVTQEAFLRAFNKLPQLTEPDRFAGWVTRIAIRAIVDHRRRTKPKRNILPGDFDPVDHKWVRVSANAERQEDIEHLRFGFMQLGRRDQETLWAFYFEGASLKELAQQFSAPEGTIKSRLHRARGRLKAVICATRNGSEDLCCR